MTRLQRWLGVAILVTSAGCLSTIIPDHTTGGSTATDGGAKNDNPQQGNSGGNATDDMGTVAAAGDMAIANDPNCVQAATPTIDGHHHSGEACLTCHNGTAATLFTAAGTVFDKATGGAGVPGVTIELVDANNKTVTLVSASQGAPGNFYTTATLAFPVTVRGSKCPYDRPMITKLQAAQDGNCARAGCHDANMQVHLP